MAGEIGTASAMRVSLVSRRNERGDRSPVDHPVRPQPGAQMLWPDPPEQGSRANFDPHQLDPISNRGQIEIGWANDLDPTRVDQLTVEDVVGQGDIAGWRSTEPAYAREERSRTVAGGEASSQRAPIRKSRLPDLTTIALTDGYAPRVVQWTTTSRNRPTLRPSRSLTSPPSRAASDMREPASAWAAVLSRARASRCRRSLASSRKREDPTGLRSCPGDQVTRLKPMALP